MEPTGHCPYVGLKQNRAIRFSSPTPEHRCYVEGDPIEIPVDQVGFCLSRNHTQCPLYMGLTTATTTEAELPPVVPVWQPTLVATPPAPQSGFMAWVSSLAPRDRLVYLAMLGLLGIIVAVYITAGLQSLNGLPTLGNAATPVTSNTTTVISTAVAGAETAEPATVVPATPTSLPTRIPSPQPTVEPTKAPIYFPPTATIAPATSVPATAVPATSAPATAVPSTPIKPSATIKPQPTSSAPKATPVPQPTSIPQPVEPTAPLPPTPQPAIPTAVPPVAEVHNEFVWLYFGDATGTLYVPVQRQVPVEYRQVARAATLALLEGPRTGLIPLIRNSAQLLGIAINNGTAVVNFDSDPADGDGRGYDALTLTLTHFSTIQRVQIQVGGRNLGSARPRPIVNPINPLSLPTDPHQTEFLPLYFLANDGYHQVRVIRMVPKTRQTAESTVRALIEGPGGYGYALQQVIPAGTDLRAISVSDGVIYVDFTQPFADAGDRASVVRTVTSSLTTLPGVRGVRYSVEGISLGDWWGAEYGRVFERGLVNGE